MSDYEPSARSIDPVLAYYPDLYRPHSVQMLGNNGGFSGAQLWRLETSAGPLCLRAWPREHPNEQQLNFIHQVLLQVHGQGLHFVPQPLRSLTGSSCVQHAGQLWELTPWMPGVADYHANPTRARLRAAMHALARFHIAAAAAHSSDPVATSPTVTRRFEELRAFLDGPPAEELRRRVPDGRWAEMDERAQRLLDRLRSHRGLFHAMLRRRLPRVPLQPVIRDIWHDHVLFTGDTVSAIIDFGATSIDTVAVDIARLLGSLTDGDGQAWAEGLEAYESIRPLSDNQTDLLVTLDRTGIVAGGLIWLRWHYLENRRFENRAGVLARVDHFLHRIEAFCPTRKAIVTPQPV